MIRKISVLLATVAAALTFGAMAAGASTPTVASEVGGGQIQSSAGPVYYWSNVYYGPNAKFYMCQVLDSSYRTVLNVSSTAATVNWNGSVLTIDTTGTFNGAPANVHFVITKGGTMMQNTISITVNPLAGGTYTYANQTSGYVNMSVQ